MVYYLTTKDNPFNPETNFDDWFSFDERKGYHTCSYLGRIAKTSPNLSPLDNEEAVNNAIDEILKFDFLNIYQKVPVNINT